MTKIEADELKNISTNKLNEWGILQPQENLSSSSGTMNWTRTISGYSEPNGSISYLLEYTDTEPKRLLLDYRMTETGEQRLISVLFTKRNCNFGGVRWYFHCPNTRCNRTCSKLYLLDTYFLCRTCHNLTYESNNRSKRYRSWDNVAKYIPDFSYDPTPFDKLYRRARRYPTYKGRPTKASLKVLKILRNLPHPDEQERILMHSLGL